MMAPESELDEPISKAKKHPIDLLRKFVGDNTAGDVPVAPAANIELSLGLSLGGCFSNENMSTLTTTISRTTSIIIPEAEESSRNNNNIARTMSLPLQIETEEERMKRKEMQSLKRFEAKRKREERKKARELLKNGEEEGVEIVNKVDVGGHFGKKNKVCGNGLVVVNGVRPLSQASIGSQGSSTSAVPEFDLAKIKQGFDVSRFGNRSEIKRASAIPSSTNKSSAYPSFQAVTKAPSLSSRELDDSSKNIISATVKPNGDKEMERNMLEEMPCVTTRGDGLNGKKIEGLLYKYKNGEDIRIVCVCHGRFLTPAEFVMHAGGGNVANPLQHIVISAAASGFF